MGNDYENFVERMRSFDMNLDDMFDSEIQNDELKHFGIKGMKWGVRRSSNKSSALRSFVKKKNKRTWSDEATVAKELKKKKLYEMSNAELKALNERLNLERNYSSLNRSNVAKGMAFLAASVTLTSNLTNIYNNSNRLIDIGKKAMGK